MIKKIFIGLLILFMLCAGLIYYAYINLDQEKITNQVTNYIESEYHRQVKVGNIAIKFLPIGLSLDQVQISENTLTNQNEKFIDIGNLYLSMDLFALIKKNIKVEKITLSNVHVNINKDAQGKFNFDDLLNNQNDKKSSQITPSIDDKSAEKADEKINKNNWSVKAVEIKNLNLSYLDEVTKASYKVSALDFNIYNFSMAQDSPIKISATLNATTPAITKAKSDITLEGLINISNDNKIKLTKLEISGNGWIELKNLGNINLSKISANGELSFEQELKLIFPKFEVELSNNFDGNNFSAKLNSEISFNNQKQKTNLTMDKINLIAKGDYLVGSGADKRVGVKRLQAKLAGKLNLIDEQFSFNGNNLELVGNIKLANAEGENSVKIGVINSAFNITNFSLAKINLELDNLIFNSKLAGGFGINSASGGAKKISLGKLGINSKDINVDGEFDNQNLDKNIQAKYNLQSRLSGNLDSNGEIKSAQLEPITLNGKVILPNINKPLNLKLVGNAEANLAIENAQVKVNGSLDNSNFAISASLKNFRNPNTKVSLSIDRFNLDEWSPPQNQVRTSVAKTSNSAKESIATKSSDIPIDFSALVGLETEIDVSAKALIARGIEVNNLSMRLAADGKSVNLNPLKFNIAEGVFNGQATLLPKEQKLEFISQVNKVNFGLLLNQIGVTEIIRGKADINTNLQTQGKSLNEFKSALTGEVKLLATDGGIKGFNIAQSIRDLKANLVSKIDNSEEKTNVGKELYTDFAELSASFISDKGILTTKDLKALSPYIRLSGEGQVDITQELLDFRIRTVLVKSAQGQGAEFSAGGGIPIKITGSMSAPKINIDDKAIKELVGAELEEKKKVLEKLAQEKIESEKQKAEEQIKQKINETKNQVESKAQQKIEDAKKLIDDKLKDKLKGLLK